MKNGGSAHGKGISLPSFPWKGKSGISPVAWSGGAGTAVRAISNSNFARFFPSIQSSQNPHRLSPSRPAGTPSFTSVFLPASKFMGSAMAPTASSRASPPTVSANPGTATARRARFVTHCARARRSFDPSDWPEHDILVAVDLKNESSEAFLFDRLFLDLGHFSIFNHEGHLWSNACQIRISEDDEDGNDITCAPNPLDPASDAPEIATAQAGKARRSKIGSAFTSVIDIIH